ncbi:NUDIX hydrolase, partial (macronuclear) [Tetrahymena thermophila SB210]
IFLTTMGNNQIRGKKHKVYGIVAYCIQNRQYLLTLNKQGHFWEFPKGYPEKRDNCDELKTALREFEEETGISQSCLRIIPHKTDLSFNYLRHGKQEKEARYFIAVLDQVPQNVKIQHSEVADFMWANYEKALQQLTYENCKNILIKVNEEIDNFLQNNQQ